MRQLLLLEVPPALGHGVTRLSSSGTIASVNFSRLLPFHIHYSSSRNNREIGQSSGKKKRPSNEKASASASVVGLGFQCFSSPSSRNYHQAPMASASASESSTSASDGVGEAEGGKRHAVVCGAGVIGACTAYFLAQKGVRVTVVEKTSVACAASGKAGGFLALDWSDGSPLGGLARASFNLHAKLADELDGANCYGYRRVDTLSVRIDEGDSAQQQTRRGGGGGNALPSWIDGVTRSASSIGSTRNTAQVHPELFTKKILSEAVAKHGAEVITGEAQEVKVSEGGRTNGVVVSGNFVAADYVVLTMGPWSNSNSLLSSLTKISPLKAHSIVLRPKDASTIGADMLFLSYRTREGKTMDPEVYPRATGEVYICGMSEEVEIPADATQIKPRKEAMTMLRRVGSTVSSHLADAELTHEQACFLPCSEDGLPVIGQIPDVGGAFVATGHSCWGILNAPGTGASLAELIVDGKSKTADLKAFDPARFRKLASRLRSFAR